MNFSNNYTVPKKITIIMQLSSNIKSISLLLLHTWIPTWTQKMLIWPNPLTQSYNFWASTMKTVSYPLEQTIICIVELNLFLVRFEGWIRVKCPHYVLRHLNSSIEWTVLTTVNCPHYSEPSSPEWTVLTTVNCPHYVLRHLSIEVPTTHVMLSVFSIYP